MKQIIYTVVSLIFLLTSCRQETEPPRREGPPMALELNDITPVQYVRKEKKMEGLKWLDGYAGQSVDELIAFEGQYRTDSIVLAFEEAVQQKLARLGDASLSDAERVIQSIEALEREVNNGGYSQFFVNSSKEFSAIIVAALKTIGCPETAALTQDAINALGIEGPISIEAVDRVMDKEDEEREEKLNDCDNRYYEAAGDLADPLLEFIKTNRDKINI